MTSERPPFKYYFIWIGNFISMLYSKLLIKFGVEFSNTEIPEGMYCYSPDEEKNIKRENFGTYYIKPCKYYKMIGRRYNGCSYLGIITDDDIFDDQCKMCSENLGMNDDEL